MYIDAGDEDDDEVSLAFSGGLFASSSTFEIRVTQIECDSAIE